MTPTREQVENFIASAKLGARPEHVDLALFDWCADALRAAQAAASGRRHEPAGTRPAAWVALPELGAALVIVDGVLYYGQLNADGTFSGDVNECVQVDTAAACAMSEGDALFLPFNT